MTTFKATKIFERKNPNIEENLQNRKREIKSRNSEFYC